MKRHSFNIPVSEETDRVLSMEDLMQQTSIYIGQHNYKQAREYLENAAMASYVPAQFRLAVLLRDTECLDISQQQRYYRCELLLSHLEQFAPNEKARARICFELGLLYEKTNRPLACLAYFLRAKRYGTHIDDQRLLACQKTIDNHLDVNGFGEIDPYGCCVLGLEYVKLGNQQKGIFFLEEAVRGGDEQGIVALTLADLLTSLDMCTMADKYYRIAAQRGNPAILIRN